MSTKNILILTGAGFGKEADLPLEKDLWKVSIEICQRTAPRFLNDVRRDWFTVFSNPLPENWYVEELLTQVEFYGNLHMKNEQEKLACFGLKNSLLQMIAQALRASSVKKPPDYYKFLINEYRDQASWFTLNYDLLVEQLLYKIGTENGFKWSYGLGPEVENLGLGSKENYAKGERKDFSNVFEYYKLHGSFNWHICLRCKRVRITDFKTYGVSGEPHSPIFQLHDPADCIQSSETNFQAKMGPFVIPPSSIKFYTSPILQKLWFKFNEFLRNIEKLIIIGCSLRDEDTLLQYSLFDLARKNSHLKDLIVVDPDPKVADKYTETIGVRARRFVSLDEFAMCH